MATPDLENVKQNLQQFHEHHDLRVKQSEKQFRHLFPDLASSKGPIGYRADIPRIDVMIDENKIGKNPPASGIRIFELH